MCAGGRYLDQASDTVGAKKGAPPLERPLLRGIRELRALQAQRREQHKTEQHVSASFCEHTARSFLLAQESSLAKSHRHLADVLAFVE